MENLLFPIKPRKPKKDRLLPLPYKVLKNEHALLVKTKINGWLRIPLNEPEFNNLFK